MHCNDVINKRDKLLPRFNLPQFIIDYTNSSSLLVFGYHYTSFSLHCIRQVLEIFINSIMFRENYSPGFQKRTEKEGLDKIMSIVHFIARLVVKFSKFKSKSKSKSLPPESKSKSESSPCKSKSKSLPPESKSKSKSSYCKSKSKSKFRSQK